MEDTLSPTTPCSYRFNTDEVSVLPMLDIHPDVIRYAGTVRGSTLQIRKLGQQCKLGDFIPKLLGTCGFSGCLLTKQATNRFIRLTPAATYFSATKGEDSWRRLNELIASFSILLNHLNKNRHAEASSKPQQLLLDIDLTRDGHWQIKADLGPGVAEWISKTTSNELGSAQIAMQKTYNHLRDRRSDDFFGFKACVVHPTGYLLLSCPNNCILKPDFPAATCERAYQIKSKGIRNAVDLFTLLAGLTQLEKLARED